MESKYDIEDLLSIIEEDVTPEKEPSSTVKRVNDRVMRFIKEYDINPGIVKVPTYVVYYHFAQWAGKVREGRTEFFRTFSQHFEQKRTKSQRYYLLDESLDMSIEVRELAKKFKSKRKTVRGKQ